jgi:hypothetical protein
MITRMMSVTANNDAELVSGSLAGSTGEQRNRRAVLQGKFLFSQHGNPVAPHRMAEFALAATRRVVAHAGEARKK